MATRETESKRVRERESAPLDAGKFRITKIKTEEPYNIICAVYRSDKYANSISLTRAHEYDLQMKMNMLLSLSAPLSLSLSFLSAYSKVRINHRISSERRKKLN